MVRQWKATRSQRQRVDVGRVRGAHTVDGALRLCVCRPR